MDKREFFREEIMEIQTSSLITSTKGGNALSSTRANSSDKKVNNDITSNSVDISVDVSNVADKIAVDQSTPQPKTESPETIVALKDASDNAEAIVYSNNAQNVQDITSAALGNTTDLTI